MENYVQDYGNTRNAESLAAAESNLIKNVYMWMALALVVTGLTAFYASGSQSFITALATNRGLMWGLIIAEFAIVLGLSFGINKISFPVAAILFALYSVVNGLTLSSIFLIYTKSSIAITFFVTAATFGAMAVYGAVTKTDLTKMGKIAMMALIGVVIASIVNIFVGSSMLDTIISIVGIIIFVGLIAYDAQKIKEMLHGQEEDGAGQKLAVMGALSLYLDFINLFIYLLRFLGDRK